MVPGLGLLFVRAKARGCGRAGLKFLSASFLPQNSLKGPKILDNDSRNLKSLVPFGFFLYMKKGTGQKSQGDQFVSTTTVKRMDITSELTASSSLSLKDTYEEHSDLYENMSPNVSVSVTVKHDSDTMDSTSVGGYSEDYLMIKDYEIEYGRNLQYSDMEARRKVAVIGAYVAEELYGGFQNAVGETIKLNGDSDELPSRFLK